MKRTMPGLEVAFIAAIMISCATTSPIVQKPCPEPEPCPKAVCPEVVSQTPCPPSSSTLGGVEVRIAVVDVQKVQENAPALQRMREQLDKNPLADEFKKLIAGNDRGARYQQLKKQFSSLAINITNKCTELIRQKAASGFTSYGAVMDTSGVIIYSQNGTAFFKDLINAGTIHFAKDDITDQVIGMLQ